MRKDWKIYIVRGLSTKFSCIISSLGKLEVVLISSIRQLHEDNKICQVTATWVAVYPHYVTLSLYRDLTRKGYCNLFYLINLINYHTEQNLHVHMSDTPNLIDFKSLKSRRHFIFSLFHSI